MAIESKKSSKLGKWFLLLMIVGLVLAYRWLNLGQYLSLEALKDNQTYLQNLFSAKPIQVAGIYLLIYILSTALSLPGATILTLAAGAIFGLWRGVVLVSIASTCGATLAFLASRYLFREAVQRRFHDKLAAINEGVRREGAFYLFTLRLVPLFPFFLVNLVMGLTPISTWTFFFVSQIGMLAGTAAYVNAGTQLAQLESLKGILSPAILMSFAAIGVLPLLSKSVIQFFKTRKYLRRYQKPKSLDYNIVVLGAGSAGLVTAYIAAAVRAKVALIEKHKMGGDCLNTGCVPSKALIRAAKIKKYIERAEEFGFSAQLQINDFSRVMERVHKVIQSIEPHDSVERYTKLGVECIHGHARIRSPYEVEVGGRILTTRNIVVATGARPLVPKIPGLEDSGYLTSDTVWNLRELPRRLVILGGGPIGCELAQSFARLGSQVTLIEKAERLMAREDEDVSALITERFRQEGVRVLTEHQAVRVDTTVSKVLVCEHGGQTVRVEFDQMLLALGRQANVTGFGLEELGVEISDRGTIAVDEYLRTSRYPNIFACGDVAGPYQFTHTASHQAWFTAVNALFGKLKKFKVDYRVIPWCTFTDPEVARVGLNEQEAREKGIEFQVAKYGIDDLDRAIAEGEDHGFVKVLTEPGRDKILGVTIVGPHAGDIVAEYVAAMKHGFGLNKILGTIHIYPTLAEANKYAAGVWKRQNVSARTLSWLEKFHRI